jgi:hypothetical protein
LSRIFIEENAVHPHLNVALRERLKLLTDRPLAIRGGSYLFSSILPTCSLCVRRLKVSKPLLAVHSSVAADQEIAVGRSFCCSSLISSHAKSEVAEKRTDNADVCDIRCIVCYTYHYYQTKDSSSLFSCLNNSDDASLSLSFKKQPSSAESEIRTLGSCFECSLLDNIWVCLICGYTGCGRYSAKHAELHSSLSCHQFSLELATGRIWEYCADRFVHFEDSSSVFNGFFQQFTNLSFDNRSNQDVFPFLSSSSSSSVTTDAAVSAFNPSSSSLFPVASATKILVSDSFLQDQDDKLFHSLNIDKHEKMNNLANEYERMIELQLRDQQLYYDKLLARETVRAMEYSFNLQRGNKVQQQQHQHQYSFGNDNSQKSNNFHDLISSNDVLLDQELEEIEKLKLDISSMEVEYKTLFDHLKEYEETTRQQKKLNELILKEQRILVISCGLTCVFSEILYFLVFAETKGK